VSALYRHAEAICVPGAARIDKPFNYKHAGTFALLYGSVRRAHILLFGKPFQDSVRGAAATLKIWNAFQLSGIVARGGDASVIASNNFVSDIQ
jgi:hypothetical protein